MRKILSTPGGSRRPQGVTLGSPHERKRESNQEVSQTSISEISGHERRENGSQRQFPRNPPNFPPRGCKEFVDVKASHYKIIGDELDHRYMQTTRLLRPFSMVFNVCTNTFLRESVKMGKCPGPVPGNASENIRHICVVFIT
ncbi:hypothetical protein RUM44_010396 [Polyplax serrata]|uniref:Uncharacterized protein n=1 Tax=Polyplax serrata TaxID=468196 RepID=A0ABR1AVC9_POLSC